MNATPSGASRAETAAAKNRREQLEWDAALERAEQRKLAIKRAPPRPADARPPLSEPTPSPSEVEGWTS